MSAGIFLPVTCADISLQGQTLFSPRYQDHYYSGDPLSPDGCAETDYVFVDGNHLPQRFRQLPPDGFFVIGETGFGSGLNFFRAALCFLETAPAGSRLFFYSSEKHPLPAPVFDALLRQRAWLPDSLKQPLTACPIPATPGFHQRLLCDGRIQLCLLYGDSSLLWPQAEVYCDAWFLDGFAPGKNPDMWQESLFATLANKSRPGATLATFTAAGFVRRSLLAQGFEARRQPGFGRKREMLVARFPGDWQPARLEAKSVAVIGAGLAGCTVARALADRGCQVTLFDPSGIAQGASGNLAGIVYSTASEHFTEQNRFYQSSFFHALGWMKRLGFPGQPSQGALNGVWHFPKDERAMVRTRNSLAAGYWPAEELMIGDHAQRQGYCFPRAGYISPPRWCAHLVEHPGIQLMTQQVRQLRAQTPGWQLTTNEQEAYFDDVVMCNSHAMASLWNNPAAAFKTVRGQVTYVKATAASAPWTQAWCHQGYLTPAIDGLHPVGATFNLHDTSDTPWPEEDAENLGLLREQLPQHWQALGGEQLQVTGSRVGLRCQSTDFLPWAGPAVDAQGQTVPGLWMSVAHGSRGITGTPLCADLIAAQILNLPLPCDQALQQALAPARFLQRALRKQGKLTPGAQAADG